ncbi:MAG: Tannase and feruloyl esterase [Rhodospirillales bacterium]|nr:Tannase and feruloyl esterase [Rhodospirillales bacterium]
MAMERIDYTSLMFDYDRHMPAAITKLSKTIDATDPDLSEFEARNRRLIHYHGGSNQGVAPMSRVDYYMDASKRLGADPSGFFRLFTVPGMQRCIGGPGPDHFDAPTALEHWVEVGKALDWMIATHLTGKAADRSHPLCPCPQTAYWTGSTNRAENFKCRPS